MFGGPNTFFQVSEIQTEVFWIYPVAEIGPLDHRAFGKGGILSFWSQILFFLASFREMMIRN